MVSDSIYKFPIAEIKCKKLKFQKQWFEKWNLLCYSEVMDGAYCKYCVLLSPSEVGMHQNQYTETIMDELSKKRSRFEFAIYLKKLSYNGKQTLCNKSMKVENRYQNLNIYLVR